MTPRSLQLLTGRDRQTHRQSDRQTDSQTDSQTDRLTDSQTDRQSDRQSDRQTVRQTDSQTDRQSDRQTDRQADRQAGRQTDRQTTDCLLRQLILVKPTYLPWKLTVHEKVFHENQQIYNFGWNLVVSNTTKKANKPHKTTSNKMDTDGNCGISQ